QPARDRTAGAQEVGPCQGRGRLVWAADLPLPVPERAWPPPVGAGPRVCLARHDDTAEPAVPPSRPPGADVTADRRPEDPALSQGPRPRARDRAALGAGRRGGLARAMARRAEGVLPR